MAEHPSRKLAVILHADVVGSSGLVRHNETLAHERIQDAFRRFSQSIEVYGGIAHELRGDALVAEFHRASDAVAAALAFQAMNAEFNATLDDDIRPQMRMGISIGEVVIADNTVTGAGVVLAQRLEQLAESGGVCIQGSAYETVPQRLPFDYESLGEQQVKGFEEPVRTYAVTLRPGETIPLPDPIAASIETLPKRAKSQWIAVGAIVLLLIVGGGVASWQPWVPREEPASIERMAFSLPDKPSIAVLPFTNMSDDPKQEYFVDGMTEDLITDLSKLSSLFVIARNSVFTYKGKPVKVHQVAEELGVRYVLEGSVRLVGDKMRINAQLIDATSGGHVWAERYDGGLTDVFDFQDAISREIIAAIKVNLKSAERLRRQATRRPPDAEAYDLVLQGVDLLRRFKLADAHKAKALFEQAIQRDAAYARPHALLALYYLDLWRLWGEGRDKNLRQALKWTEKAIQLDDTDPTPYVIAAYVYQFLREFGASKAEADKALALRPNDAVTLANLGDLLAWAHRPMEAVTMLERAIRLDPFHPPTYLDWLSFAYAMSDRHADCIRVAERGLAFAPDFVGLHVDLAICYASLGQTEEAQRAGREILRTNPRFRISAFAKYVPFSEQADIDRTVAALRQAGLPE